MEPQFPTQGLALNPELHGPVLDSVSQQGLQAVHASWVSWLPGTDGRQGQGLGQTARASASMPKPGDQDCLSWGLQDPSVPGASCLGSELQLHL